MVVLSLAFAKTFWDSLITKKDVTTLKEQRKADLIEFNTTAALAKGFETKFESRVKDLIYEFSEQRHKDNQHFEQQRQKDIEQRHQENEATRKVLGSLDNTLGKLHTTLDFLREDVKDLKSKH